MCFAVVRPKRPANYPKCPPRCLPDSVKTPQDAPRWPQDGAKISPRGSQMLPKRRLTPPRCTQDAFKMTLGHPKPPPRRPKSPQDHPEMPLTPPQRHPFGVNFNDNFNLVGFSLLALPHAFEAEKLPRSPTGSLPSIDFIDSTVLLIASQISLEPCSPVVTFVSFR